MNFFATPNRDSPMNDILNIDRVVLITHFAELEGHDRPNPATAASLV